jgi:hypothetical protein
MKICVLCDVTRPSLIIWAALKRQYVTWLRRSDFWVTSAHCWTYLPLMETLGYCAMSLSLYPYGIQQVPLKLPTFVSSCTLMMEAVASSEAALNVYRRINKIALQIAAFFTSLSWDPQISSKNEFMASEKNNMIFVTGPFSLVLLLLPIRCRCRGLWLYLTTLNVTHAR